MRIWLGERLIALDRNRVGHGLLLRVLRRAITWRFDPAAATGLEATLELALRDPHGRGTARYGVRIADGCCRVEEGPPDGATARASLGSDDLIRLASGAVAWPELFSGGRFELTGDPFLALRFASLFQLPVVLDPVSPVS